MGPHKAFPVWDRIVYEMQVKGQHLIGLVIWRRCAPHICRLLQVMRDSLQPDTDRDMESVFVAAWEAVMSKRKPPLPPEEADAIKRVCEQMLVRDFTLSSLLLSFRVGSSCSKNIA